MPSFDVVSRLEMQEVDNALSNAMKEITQRYDFKGSISKLERSDNIVTLLTEDDMKAKQVIEILTSHLIKQLQAFSKLLIYLPYPLQEEERGFLNNSLLCTS